MNLFIFFCELPTQAALEALDRRLNAFSKTQDPLPNEKRLWITHVPETATRPFLHARPFDIFVAPIRFSSSEIEDYRVSLGQVPKRRMVCRCEDESPESLDVMFCLAVEIMTRMNAFLSVSEDLIRTMFQTEERDIDFLAQHLDDLPGSVYELAHEQADGELKLEWFVDAKWLRSWLAKRHRDARFTPNSTTSRFASLDY